jgi:hypothetical protein
MHQLGADAHFKIFNSVIGPYTLEYPQDFMGVMADDNAVIIRSAALSIILRMSKWKLRDLNIIVLLSHSHK